MMPGIVMIGFGVAVIISGLVQLDRARAMKGWSSVLGEVSSTRIVEKVGSRDFDSPGSASHTYHPDVRYSYVLNGTDYAGTRRSFADTGASWRGYAEGVLARYPVGKKVTVYYDPQNPRDSILERGNAKAWATGLTVAGAVVVIAGFVWAWKA
jgi:Protein of unknown function (DUF3592)